MDTDEKLLLRVNGTQQIDNGVVPSQKKDGIDWLMLLLLLRKKQKRRESSQRNYFIISPRVIIKAIIII